MTLISLSALETWLWNSADILRGSIDSSDFKNYIFAFNHSRFRITVSGRESQHQIREALDDFYREKAAEKIGPRVVQWSEKTGIE